MKHKRRNGRYAKSALHKRLFSYLIRTEGMSKKQLYEMNRNEQLKFDMAIKAYRQEMEVKQ